MLNTWLALLMRKPSPARAPASSPTTTPISPRPTPNRKPAKIYGAALGSATLVKICSRVAPNERAASIKPWSVCKIPASVLMIIGKITKLTTTATFDQMPTPNHRIKSGANAMMGEA